ncbi:hypothetical protein G6O67_007189 [Ophiocordyceps sinensis]|uniref:GRF-type domain-containing protein n=1 Tax=Ophiocordyceps sinensis TaxID=72228 RepID=A0A8H4LUM9_9HYPO|nr:hypothetical protein G6O67_007189 [Ophiocordyceps sinensis]
MRYLVPTPAAVAPSSGSSSGGSSRPQSYLQSPPAPTSVTAIFNPPNWSRYLAPARCSWSPQSCPTSLFLQARSLAYIDNDPSPPPAPQWRRRPPPRHRRGDSPETPASRKKRLKGLWQGGHWWCNCEPRKKAVLRDVKKDTPNKGRFFWACPVYSGCDFLLWHEDAVARSAGPVSAAEELPPAPKTPTFTQRRLTSFGVQISPGRRPGAESFETEDSAEVATGSNDSSSQAAATVSASTSASTLATPEKRGVATPVPGSSKRNRDMFDSDDDFSDFGSNEERQLADIADSSAEKLGRKVGVLATPKAAEPAAAADAPSPAVARTLFPGPDPKRAKTVTFDDAQPTGLPTPARSPAATRLAHPVVPPSSPQDAQLDSVVGDVMARLESQPVDRAVLASVGKLLVDSVRRTRGVSMGREALHGQGGGPRRPQAKGRPDCAAAGARGRPGEQAQAPGDPAHQYEGWAHEGS